MLSIISIMLVPGGIIIIPAHAASGDQLLTINNPTPARSDFFSISVATTPTGDILVGARYDDTGATDAGSAYLFDGNNGSLLLTINNPTPATSDRFGISVATTDTGDILVGAYLDDTGVTDAGSVYLFEGITSNNNNPPVLDFIPNQSVDENDSLVFPVTATDADSDPISFGISPLLNFTSFVDNGDDTATFLTNPGFSDSGVYNFNVTASDGIDDTWQVFELTVNDMGIPPTITSLLADDPDDLDDIYSREDTITITFDSDTNEPGESKVQRKPAIDDMFTFSENLGRAYSGKWIAPDTFIITIHSDNNAGPPVIGGTIVTPTGITPILSADETSVPSSALSPVLSGDFGIP